MTFAVVPTAARTSQGRRTLAAVSPRSRARYSCPKEEASAKIGGGAGLSNCCARALLLAALGAARGVVRCSVIRILTFDATMSDLLVFLVCLVDGLLLMILSVYFVS